MMKNRIYLFITIILLLTSISFVTVGYSIWKVEIKETKDIDVESYDIINVDSVTLTPTKKLNPSVFSYVGETDPNTGTLGYNLNTTEYSTLYCMIEAVNGTIPENALEGLKLGDSTTISTTYDNGVIKFTLYGLTLNTNHKLTFSFNNKLIYHSVFNQSGIDIDDSGNITMMFTIYDGA